MTESRDTRTRLVHSIKASASGLNELQIAEIIRKQGQIYGYTPAQSWIGFPTSIPSNTQSTTGWSAPAPAGTELVHEGDKNDPSEVVSVYMEVQEGVDQSYTHADTPTESVRVSEGTITRWLRTVPGESAHTPSALTVLSPPEVTNLSEMQRTAVQSPLPVHRSNYRSPSITLPSPARATSHLPEPIPPYVVGKTPWDGQADKYVLSPQQPQCYWREALEAGIPQTTAAHSEKDKEIRWLPTSIPQTTAAHHQKQPQIVQRRSMVRGRRLPAQRFESDVATLCARLLNEGAKPHYVDLLHRTIFPNGISNDALMAPMSANPNPLSGKQWTEKAWQLLCERTVEEAGSIVYFCRLCPESRTCRYKYNRDVLRHLMKHHFGLAFACEHW